MCARASSPLLALTVVLASPWQLQAERYADPLQHSDQKRSGVALSRFQELDSNGDGKVEKKELALAYGGVSEAMEKLLALADVNGDGSLDATEAESLSGYLDGSELVGEAYAGDADADAGEETDGDEDVMAFLFRSLDADQDGKIERDELLSAAAREEVPGFADIAEKLFVLADTDEDGALDRAEAERFMELLDGYASESGLLGTPDAAQDEGIQPSSGEEEDPDVDVLADFFRGLDADQDGKIDRRELVNAAMREEDPSFPVLVEKLFSLADEDGDGALDRSEAERFMELLDEHASQAGWFSDEDIVMHQEAPQGAGDDDDAEDEEGQEQDEVEYQDEEEEVEEDGVEAARAEETTAEADDEDEEDEA